jgi:hypothetical protein
MDCWKAVSNAPTAIGRAEESEPAAPS